MLESTNQKRFFINLHYMKSFDTWCILNRTPYKYTYYMGKYWNQPIKNGSSLICITWNPLTHDASWTEHRINILIIWANVGITQSGHAYFQASLGNCGANKHVSNFLKFLPKSKIELKVSWFQASLGNCEANKHVSNFLKFLPKSKIELKVSYFQASLGNCEANEHVSNFLKFLPKSKIQLKVSSIWHLLNLVSYTPVFYKKLQDVYYKLYVL